jgi:hypothetical protein
MQRGLEVSGDAVLSPSRYPASRARPVLKLKVEHAVAAVGVAGGADTVAAAQVDALLQLKNGQIVV